jgi:two-component system response regulator FlrC
MRDMMKPAILIIENDEDTRRLYADLLTYTDAKIVEAGNPYEAFEQLRRNPISLIVTDLHMPGGGVDYLTHLRQKEPTCPIIAITGVGGDTVREAAIAAGATLFLEKPIKTKQLRQVIERFLPRTPHAA